jgi:hypothetical protein
VLALQFFLVVASAFLQTELFISTLIAECVAGSSAAQQVTPSSVT